MPGLSILNHKSRGRVNGAGSPQRPVLLASSAPVLKGGQVEGLLRSSSASSATSSRRHSGACCSTSAGRQDTAGAVPTRLARHRTVVLPPSPSNRAGDDSVAECCCGSGSCSHRHDAGGAVRGGRQWRLIPRDLLVGAALAVPLCTAVAVANAAGGGDVIAAAAATAATASASSTAAVPFSAVDVTAAELVAAGVTSVVPPGYVPSPIEPGWEIWLGFVAGVVPFAIGSYEFGKRIIIQLRCEQCGGRGLVPSSGPGRDKYLRKCPTCGGFFPWISWKMFLSSTAAPGNGGPLQAPRGQTSVFYSLPDQPDPAKQAEALARSQATIDALQARGQRPKQDQQQLEQAAGEVSAAPVSAAPAGTAPAVTAAPGGSVEGGAERQG